MKLVGSNHKTAAAWNRSLAVQLLRRHGVLSRNDISRMTKLQGSTLSYIVRELLERSVIRIVGKRPSSQVGQKQVLLALNPELGWLLGISLRPQSADMIMLDAAGGRIDGMQMVVEGSLETLPAKLRDGLTRWLRKRGSPAGTMLGVGIAVPGVIDADAGVVLRSIPFRAVNVPLRQIAWDQFGVTTVVDHDACHGAFAESTDGAAADVSDFLYFSINGTSTGETFRLDSYGSALFLQGKLYRGAFYGAGELSGSLEPTPMVVTKSDMATLADAAGPMPPALVELASRIGRSLGPIINLVDVQMVVMAGSVRILNRRFIAALQAEVTEQLVAVPGRAVRVVRSNWEPESSARGAAISAFSAVVDEGQLFGDHNDRRIIRVTKDPSQPA